MATATATYWTTDCENRRVEATLTAYLDDGDPRVTDDTGGVWYPDDAAEFSSAEELLSLCQSNCGAGRWHS